MRVIVPLSIIIPIIIAVIFYKYLAKCEKIILLYLFLSGVTNIVVAYMASLGENNIPLFHIYTVFEFVLLMWFFIKLFRQAIVAKYLYIVAIIFVLFAVSNSLFIQHIRTFNTYSRSAEAIIVMVICMYYFKQQFIKEINWAVEPGFWFVLGLFIYFSSSLTIFIISNVSLALDRYFDWVMWNIHATMVLIMYLLFSKGFMVCRK